MRISKAALYSFLLTAFFWLVQFNDLWRVKWFFDTLIGDGEVASWLMTLVIELGMGLLSLELLSRVTANNQRQRREGKLVGYKQPVALLIFSVLLLGALETFVSVAFFYEFGQVTSLTSRLLRGDTFWIAVTFGSVSAILTFVFAAVEGERTRIEQRKSEKEQERAERKRKRMEAERAVAVQDNTEAVLLEIGPVQEQNLTARERVVAVLEAEPGATGAQVAELAGCSASYARKIKRAYKGESK